MPNTRPIWLTRRSTSVREPLRRAAIYRAVHAIGVAPEIPSSTNQPGLNRHRGTVYFERESSGFRVDGGGFALIMRLVGRQVKSSWIQMEDTFWLAEQVQS